MVDFGKNMSIFMIGYCFIQISVISLPYNDKPITFYTMETAINTVKSAIFAQKDLLENLMDQIDAANAVLDYQNEEQVNAYYDLKEQYRKEENKLSYLRSALVSLRQANGEDLFSFSTFVPEA